ncbi:MAG: tRNA uridine-5-carboxymethylaminomethyl(34) synthesis GTPase MnmE [Candidatus Eiseniibacteriota bacterium]
MKDLGDTIAAIATAPGSGGLAVLRVSGPRALEIAGALFPGGDSLESAPDHSLRHGWAHFPGRSEQRLDEVVASVFHAPRSYTCEDVVEISCHGGSLTAKRVLEALVAAGAREALPGEFTLRAFLNGRLDLAQAEAVADLIQAENEAARELALAQLAGSLSRKLAEVEERVLGAAAEVEARVDFAEDVGGIEVPAHVHEAIQSASAELDRLLAGAPYARAIREGLHVPLIGRPNVGKSSLFNALLGEDRAIVTSVPGTTRDRVSESVEISRLRVRLSDTAGLREQSEPIERLGIERAREALSESRIAIWVLDASAPLAQEDLAVAAALAGRRVLVAFNKCDRELRIDREHVAALLNGQTWKSAQISAITGVGLDELRQALAELAGAGTTRSLAGAVAAHPRHVASLERARAALERAKAASSDGLSGEIVALELREALERIGEVSGRRASEELLDRIFSRFCIGK